MFFLQFFTNLEFWLKTLYMYTIYNSFYKKTKKDIKISLINVLCFNIIINATRQLGSHLKRLFALYSDQVHISLQ